MHGLKDRAHRQTSNNSTWVKCEQEILRVHKGGIWHCVTNTRRLIPDKSAALNKSLNWSHIIFRLTEHCSGLLAQDKEGWDLQ